MAISTQQLFDQIHQIPQIPEVIRELINQLNDHHADISQIVKNVQKEQVIALRVLRLVNSAHFGLSRKVNSIEEATMLIGMAQLKTLVIASGLIGSVPDIPNFDIKAFWTGSFRGGAYAQYFAELAGMEADVAYTAGLLSRFGRLLIQIGLPKEANEIDQHTKAGGHTRTEIELNRLGFTNQTVCAELCRRWKLGTDLIDAIQHSANPAVADQPNKLACVVFLGNFVSDLQDQALNAEAILAELPEAVLAQIGLHKAALEGKIETLLNLDTNMNFDA